ncbi:MAG: hypothetical protein P1Q69_13445 [Candidatus Thorarchaeota archaeon]|nr:hypothetical protein [Candidatus Thorarchaeota archaeon]
MSDSPRQYERRLQLKHFFNDPDNGAKRRTWLELQMTTPQKSVEGWVNEGKVRLSLGEDKDIKGAFLLNIDEACRLYKTLDIMVQEHESMKAQLWRE